MITVTHVHLLATLTKESAWAKKVIPLIKQSGSPEFADELVSILQGMVNISVSDEEKLGEAINCANTLRAIYIILAPLHAALGNTLPRVTPEFLKHELLEYKHTKPSDDPDIFFYLCCRQHKDWSKLLRSNIKLLNEFDKLIVMCTVKAFLDALEIDFEEAPHNRADIETFLNSLRKTE